MNNPNLMRDGVHRTGGSMRIGLKTVGLLLRVDSDGRLKNAACAKAPSDS
jgi:hypothetical protein